MLGQSVIRWRKCLHRQTTLSSLPKSQPLLLSFSTASSEKESDQYIDYLLPPAYRKDSKKQDDWKNNGYGKRANYRGDSTNRRGATPFQNYNRRHSPHNKARGNNSSPIFHRSQRRPSVGQRGPSKANADAGAPTIESISQLEKTLSLKMNEYTSRLGGVSSLDIGANDLDRINDEAGSIPSNLLGPSNSLVSLNDDSHNNGIDIAGIYSTEESYKEIVSLFRELIVGWANVAESITVAKRKENAYNTDRPVVLVLDYEEAVLKAEHHLESFEALFRNRVNVVTRGKSMLEELDKKGGSAAGEQGEGKPLFGKLSSIIGDFFTNTKPSNYDANQTLRQTDGRAVPKVVVGKEVDHPTVADFEAILESHQNRDHLENTSLYEHVLVANHSSYCFGMETKEESTQRSNRLLNRWISLYCLTGQSNATTVEGKATSNETNNEREAAERKIFHTVIRQNVDLATVEGVQRAEEWLGRMRHMKEMGGGHCMPDVETYNLIFLGFCNVCKIFRADQSDVLKRNYDKVHATKRFVFDGVERTLTELNKSKGEGPSPNVTSLNLALNAIAKGRNMPQKKYQRTNALLYNVIGEKNYREMMMGSDNDVMDESVGGGDGKLASPSSGETRNSEVQQSADLENSTQSYVKPNLDTYHWLVDIHSRSGKLVYIKQGVFLLRKMIQIRMEDDSDFSSNQDRSINSPASFAPSTGTHNNVLRALAKTGSDLSDFNVDRANIATEISELLDSMVQYGSSIPTHVTFLFALHICQKTKSPEAGDLAEEILSKMEVVETYQPEMKSFSHAYLLALECWLSATKAGKSGAAERAFRLFELMEAQAGRDRSQLPSLLEGEEPDVFDRSMQSHVRMYPLMLKICAATTEKQDMNAAMAIAFQVYEKMIQDKIKPNPKTFEMMYTCVRNFLDHHPDEERQGLLQKVFEPASNHGITRGELMGRHKQSQRKGHLAA